MIIVSLSVVSVACSPEPMIEVLMENANNLNLQTLGFFSEKTSNGA